MSLRISQIEDEPSQEAVELDTLHSFRVTIRTYSSKNHFIRYMNHHPVPDVLLIDLLLDGKLEGFDILRAVNAISRFDDVPKIGLSNLFSNDANPPEKSAWRIEGGIPMGKKMKEPDCPDAPAMLDVQPIVDKLIELDILPFYRQRLRLNCETRKATWCGTSRVLAPREFMFLKFLADDCFNASLTLEKFVKLGDFHPDDMLNISPESFNQLKHQVQKNMGFPAARSDLDYGIGDGYSWKLPPDAPNRDTLILVEGELPAPGKSWRQRDRMNSPTPAFDSPKRK